MPSHTAYFLENDEYSESLFIRKVFGTIDPFLEKDECSNYNVLGDRRTGHDLKPRGRKGFCDKLSARHRSGQIRTTVLVYEI